MWIVLCLFLSGFWIVLLDNVCFEYFSKKNSDDDCDVFVISSMCLIVCCTCFSVFIFWNWVFIDLIVSSVMVCVWSICWFSLVNYIDMSDRIWCVLLVIAGIFDGWCYIWYFSLWIVSFELFERMGCLDELDGWVMFVWSGCGFCKFCVYYFS
jgi:hypothetical protein